MRYINLLTCLLHDDDVQFKCQLFFFKLTTNQNFDIVIMIVILLNMTSRSRDVTRTIV